MGIMKSPKRKLSTPVEFVKVISSLTLTRLYGCCLLFNVSRIKQIIMTGALLDELGNPQIIIAFKNNTVSTEVKPLTEVIL